jgi:hypothetical protein
MIRLQIQLTEEQVERLRRRALERHTSTAALVREAVDLSLREADVDRRWERALAVLGRFDGGAADVSAEHDRYLDEAFGT